jgi:hypothetical protein
MLCHFDADAEINLRADENVDSKATLRNSSPSVRKRSAFTHGPSMPDSSLAPSAFAAASEAPSPQPTSSTDVGWNISNSSRKMVRADRNDPGDIAARNSSEYALLLSVSEVLDLTSPKVPRRLVGTCSKRDFWTRRSDEAIWRCSPHVNPNPHPTSSSRSF